MPVAALHVGGRRPDESRDFETKIVERSARIAGLPESPNGAFQLGGVAELGSDRSLTTDSEDHDQVKLRFVTTDELHSENVAAFFQAHLESLTSQRQVAV